MEGIGSHIWAKLPLRADGEALEAFTIRDGTGNLVAGSEDTEFGRADEVTVYAGLGKLRGWINGDSIVIRGQSNRVYVNNHVVNGRIIDKVLPEIWAELVAFLLGAVVVVVVPEKIRKRMVER